MIGNRREFVKATAAMTVLGGTEAGAYSNSDHWIALVHSGQLHAKAQVSFLSRLRQNGYEGDPQQGNPSSSGKTGVNILYFNYGSKYKSTGNDTLTTAITSMINELPKGEPQVLVATGGMVSALAIPANLKKSGTQDPLPVLVLMGRQASLSGGNTFGGFYFDTIGSGVNVNLKNKARYLHDNYGIPYKNQWLIYNKNSNMGDSESAEWPVVLVPTQLLVPQKEQIA